MDRVYRAYAHITKLVTLFVRAPDAKEARRRARERLLVDHSPSEFATLNEPYLASVRDQLDAETEQDLLDGRALRPGEVDYCRARYYAYGFDIDSFDGVQLHHIVDDGVTLCRTTALWGSGSLITEPVRVSCPLCLDALYAEMRYPHPELMAYYRRQGNRAVADLTDEDADGAVVLLVNGVEVRRIVRAPDSDPNKYDEVFGAAWDELHALKEKINDEPRASIDKSILAMTLRAYPPPKGDVFRSTAISLRLRMREAERDGRALDRDALALWLSEVEAKMGPDERAYVERYFEPEG